MDGPKFSKGEAIRFGWETMKKNLGFFIVLMIIVGIIQIVPDFVSDLYAENNPALWLLIFICAYILNCLVAMGQIEITLKLCDDRKPRLDDLFSCANLLLKYIAVSILYSLIVLGGLILLIIPGIIFAIKYQFCIYFLVDQNTGIMESLKKSGEITDGAKLDLFLFGWILAGIVLLGALCLLVGLFAAVPTAMVAHAWVFRVLNAKAGLPRADVEIAAEERVVEDAAEEDDSEARRKRPWKKW
ncbi:MAG: hypothetical protein E3J72_16935 [Planctomycetota bacterium]|nr:MAG: hypothetical protein E3J72_16935 [Planctomycetota bacterium]